VGRFLDYPSFFRSIGSKQKVFWRLSDMNPLTGGCHYDGGCGRFLGSCGHCPQLANPHKEDESQRGFLLKKRVFARLQANPIHFIAASRWMFSLVQKSPLTGNSPVHLLPLGVDTDIFCDPGPERRREIRNRMGIPASARVLLAGAGSLAVLRKGGAMLAEVLARLGESPPWLVLSLGDESLPEIPGISCRHLGKVPHGPGLAEVYAAADLLLFFPSQENLANMLMESMACGTPAVATNVGGNPDCVKEGLNGWLVPPGEAAQAARKVIQYFILRKEPKNEIRAACRQTVEKNFCQKRRARHFSDLYAEIFTKESKA
jgi:glycosyltransferase involved in cell wall biosynthesis